RQHHRIQPVHTSAQRLRPEIRRGVNHHVLPAARNQQGRAQPLVVRVLRFAHRAMATQRRHAHRRPRPQHPHPQFFRFPSSIPSIVSTFPLSQASPCPLRSSSAFSVLILSLLPLSLPSKTKTARTEIRAASCFLLSVFCYLLATSSPSLPPAPAPSAPPW